MSELIVIGSKGRERYEWDPREPRSVATARDIFEDKLDEGYAAFSLFRARGTGPQQMASTELIGEQLHDFDSKAETIQMTPPLVGG